MKTDSPYNPTDESLKIKTKRAKKKEKRKKARLGCANQIK